VSNRIQNRILSRLSRADLMLLESNLEPLDLPVRMQLHPRNRRIDYVYFPESGIVSLVGNGEQGLEIGIIGEGMTGVARAMGIDDRPRYETFVQVSGKGHRLAAGHLKRIIGGKRHLTSGLHAVRARVHDADSGYGPLQWPPQDRRAVGTLAASG
jgi:hypothetical protein